MCHVRNKTTKLYTGKSERIGPYLAVQTRRLHGHGILRGSVARTKMPLPRKLKDVYGYGAEISIKQSKLVWSIICGTTSSTIRQNTSKPEVLTKGQCSTLKSEDSFPKKGSRKLAYSTIK